ncbi:MAG: glycogen synthase GlgA [Clostridiaceae bacterium]|nr:glycogen synthase GlgA [Clostridiaceae bacterium]MDD6704721.1 glycogen synthase GlgA [Clostridiaceae bacterium]MDD7615644.1 glycogen synthase GlgA [Clostridiaceae bacterium]MDY5889297.1 glycogen synthase GlgA [Oscillospiraceae bacterium]MDY5933944.1 glycogen synthase GlgA [Oscillospiraceae bacterium]
MKVLFASSEALPFMASGGLGDVAGSLPHALRKRLIGCRVVMPMYDTIRQELKDKMKFITHISVPVAWRRQYCGIFEAKHNGVIYYLLDNQYYFKRNTIYGHYDDAERFAFFSRAILEIIPHIDFKPDIIHCNDWQTALTPVYYSAMYANSPGYENIKTIFTIHNIQYQGIYGMELLQDVLGIPADKTSLLEYDGCVNFMKGAIECADKVTTVSPSYANEILDPWYSHGLDSILNERRYKLSGILNGIDTVGYDPETDKDIKANYSAADPSGKKEDKEELQKLMNLPVKPNVPIVGMVTRLVSHKGLDLVKGILDELLSKAEMQLVVLGSGDYEYESYFRWIAEKYPDKVGLRLGFVPDLARKIYAGADMFLMPSKSEPCGLSQMVALRYGTIPIVRETGGLRDSITDCGDGKGNGFTFKSYNAHDMLDSIYRALTLYYNGDWNELVLRALNCDFSWGRSANAYIRLYKELLKG